MTPIRKFVDVVSVEDGKEDVFPTGLVHNGMHLNQIDHAHTSLNIMASLVPMMSTQIICLVETLSGARR